MDKSKGFNNIYVERLGKRESLVIIGGSGTGKSTMITSFIAKEFKDAFADMIKNDKEREKLAKVESDDNLKQEIKNDKVMKFNITNHGGHKEYISVCIKRKNIAIFREELNDIFAESFYSTVLNFRNGEAGRIDISGYFKERFSREVKESVFYEFLASDIDNFINKAIFNFKGLDMLYIYNLAKNKMSKNDKSNEEFVKAAIKQQIFLNKELTLGKIIIDFDFDFGFNEDEDIDLDMDTWLKVFDKKIESCFEETLGEYSISRDGYYVKKFTGEDLAGDGLNLWKKIINGKKYFAFIEEIVVNVPMNENIERVIKEQGNTSLVNRNGNITLSVYDYNYKTNGDTDREYKLLEEFIFAKNISGVIDVREENKPCEVNDAVLVKIGKVLNKNISLFVVHNKMDILIDRQRSPKIKSVEDILEIGHVNSSEDLELDDAGCRKIIDVTKKHTQDVLGNFVKFQSEKKKKFDVYINHSFFSYNIRPEKELIDEYRPINFVRVLIGAIAKPKVKALDVEVKGSEDNIKFDLGSVERAVNSALNSKEGKRCINAMKQNITENLGLGIDRDTFKMIEHRIKLGENLVYSSEKESSLGGVNIQFPLNFKNMISEVVIRDVIGRGIDFGEVEIGRVDKDVMINEIVKLRGSMVNEIAQRILYEEFAQVIMDNSLEREAVIFDKYLTRLYDNLIGLDKDGKINSSDIFAAKQDFKERLRDAVGNVVLAYTRLIFKEEGKV